jgi:hypothetical protein
LALGYASEVEHSAALRHSAVDGLVKYLPFLTLRLPHVRTVGLAPQLRQGSPAWRQRTAVDFV